MFESDRSACLLLDVVLARSQWLCATAIGEKSCDEYGQAVQIVRSSVASSSYLSPGCTSRNETGTGLSGCQLRLSPRDMISHICKQPPRIWLICENRGSSSAQQQGAWPSSGSAEASRVFAGACGQNLTCLTCEAFCFSTLMSKAAPNECKPQMESHFYSKHLCVSSVGVVSNPSC